MTAFLRAIQQELAAEGIDDAFLQNTKFPSLFVNLRSKHKREKIYVMKCGMVYPQEVILGTTFISRRGKLVEVQDKGYYIPFKRTIRLLNLPEFVNQLQQSHCSHDGIMRDVCDGAYVKTHPILGEEGTIQIILNTDELELTNPLGTHVKKHKIMMFYALFGNILPQYRSKLATIQLVAVAKSVHIKKHGIKNLLCDFLSTVNELTTCGVSLILDGQAKVIKSNLALVPADTPAAQSLGGFKEGVSFAQKPCRRCNIDTKSFKSAYHSSAFKLRNENEHKERCNVLADKHLTKAAKRYWSKVCGINGQSLLSTIKILTWQNVLSKTPCICC